MSSLLLKAYLGLSTHLTFYLTQTRLRKEKKIHKRVKFGSGAGRITELETKTYRELCLPTWDARLAASRCCLAGFGGGDDEGRERVSVTPRGHTTWGRDEQLRVKLPLHQPAGSSLRLLYQQTPTTAPLAKGSPRDALWRTLLRRRSGGRSGAAMQM